MSNEKILIVDDEMDVLDLCKRILTASGYQIDSANNGYEAIEIARKKRFDLLLTDIKMPGISGLEITQQIKDIDPRVVCVTMTGYSTMDTAINALKLGIDEFILKPFTPKELGAAVAKALEKERLRRENFRLRSLIPLFELNKTLVSTVDEETLLNRVLEIVQQETEASFTAVFLTGNNRVSTAYFHEHKPHPVVRETSFKLAGQTLHIAEATRLDLSSTEYRSYLEAMDVTSAIAVPLKSQNSTLGLIIVGLRDKKFAPSDSEFLSVLSGQAGTALENARLFTEIQDAYRQLQQLDYMKSEFINIAAHELRTPLAILLGYAAVLEEEEEENIAQDVSLASSISRNAMRLRSLIDDMLNLQYLESGIPTLQQDIVDLEEVVQQITQDVGLLVEEKQLDIKIDIATNFPAMIIDRQKLDLILLNLIHNAVKFTPTTGKIIIRADAEDEYARVSVYNSGSVIPEEKLNQVFDRFFQVEHTLTREHGGAGLGLSIVRGMVDVCGGSITVESSEAAGTTFSFTLPLDNTHLEARKLKL